MRGRRDILPPVAAFLAATAVAFTCAWIAGYDPLAAATWSRWDSFHYVTIALDGYVDTQRNCPGSEIACAHAGWLPGYSVPLAGAIELGLPALTSAIALSWAFCLATLALLWWRFPLPAEPAARLAVLTYAAFVPGWIYMHTIFPLSMLTFLALATLVLLERGRAVAAGLTGAAAAATYPLGVLLAPIAGLWFLVTGAGIKKALIAGGLTAAGLVAALVASGLWTGDYLGYFHAQQHDLRDPVSGVITEVKDALRADRVRLEAARAVQVVLTTAVAAVVLAVLVVRRKSLARLDVLAGSFALAAWALPLTQEGLSVYRSNAALLVAAPLLRHVGSATRWAIAGTSFAVGIPMAVLFFQGKLV